VSSVLWLVLTFAVRPASGAEADCSRALYFLCNRHRDRAWLDSAEMLVAGVRQHEPSDPAAMALQTRLLLQRGDAAASRAERIALYNASRAVADTLRRTYPNDPRGHLWWATAQGRIGELQGIMSSLGMAGDIVRSLDRTIAIDSGCALAWYARGRLYEVLPGIMGGSLKRAEECFRRGIAADPNYTVIPLGLARLLVREKRWAEARRQLELLLTTANPTHPAEFELDDRPAAMELLRSIEVGRK
jgi:hypothetical protein